MNKRTGESIAQEIQNRNYRSFVNCPILSPAMLQHAAMPTGAALLCYGGEAFERKKIFEPLPPGSKTNHQWVSSDPPIHSAGIGSRREREREDFKMRG